jgi:hypothetical protein
MTGQLTITQPGEILAGAMPCHHNLEGISPPILSRRASPMTQRPTTTQLYDRRCDEVNLDEVEKIGV